MNNPYAQDPRGSQAEYATYGASESNPLGIVGFVLSITCLLAPIGLFVSIIALFKRPKGFAIAGTIIGLIFSGLWALAGAGVYMVNNQWRGGMAIGILGLQSEVLKEQIDRYNTETGAYPTSLDQVNLPSQARNDPWGTAYEFVPAQPGGTWAIRSAGPDKQFGTSDDIANIVDFEDSITEDMAEEWMSLAQTDRENWPGLMDAFSAGRDLEMWMQQNDEASAVAGSTGSPDAALPPVDPETPEDPATPDTPDSP